MDRMEELWQGPDAEQIRVRPVRQAEELPSQGLPEMIQCRERNVAAKYDNDTVRGQSGGTYLVIAQAQR